ncbi:metallophosphoesterase family protein [Chondromyces crocatus]|uniref:Metallophosphoesterase n=1 Tax=Chondromyces crocatus TaxID=52 RepID=A0A0K1ERS7_CHOCO|nr:DNA repair exonuclease [Chondromyces crocatus]AKT43323.1 metallophosphoesterase [Chondromyces crocatus]
MRGLRRGEPLKIVHAADLHIDSPLRGLERYEGAPVAQIRGATRRAFENLIGLCLAEEVDLLLLAGDIYDGDWRDYNTGLFFAAQLSRLRSAGVRVIMVRGNHDAQSQITRHLELPEHVRVLDHQAPERIVDERLGVAVVGQSFPTRAVTDDLAAAYPDALPGLFNIGLLHTALGGREGHENYAPCTLGTLLGRGYQYWALGHIHAREVVNADPLVVFPGNLQGRHAREAGEKGATLLTVEGGRVTSMVHRPLDVVRWQVCEVDVSGAQSGLDAVDLAREQLEQALAEAGGRAVAARVVLRGKTRAHAELHGKLEQWTQQLRAAANDAGGEGLWVEQVRLKTWAPVDAVALGERDDAIGQLARSLRSLRDDDQELGRLLGELSGLRAKLPAEAREMDEGLRLEDPALLKDALEDVEQLLLSRLLSKSSEG